MSKRAPERGSQSSPERTSLTPYLSWLAVVLGLELFVALNVSDSILTDWPALAAYVQFVSRLFPAVDHFNSIAAHPELVRFYLSIAPLFLLPKIFVAYRWLTSDYLGTYRHLVLSPLTTHQPSGIGEFLTGGAPSTKPDSRESGKPRSTFARFVGSLIFMLMCLFAIFMWSMWGWELVSGTDTLRSVHAAYIRFSRGRFWMWWEWGYRSMVAALLLAVVYCIARDYVRWIAISLGLTRKVKP